MYDIRGALLILSGAPYARISSMGLYTNRVAVLDLLHKLGSQTNEIYQRSPPG